MTNLPEINPFVGPRPRDHIEDQLTALRGVIRRRNEQTGRRHFVHEPWCRASYVRWIIETRRVLRAE